MDNTPNKPEIVFKTACYFEGALILVAIVLGFFADIDPFEHIHYSEKTVFYGVLGTLPLFFIFLVMEQISNPSITKIRQILLDSLGSSMYKNSWADLFILAAIAGIAEETLFRGVIQPWIENSWGMMEGLIASSILFGLVHAVTPLYAILAMTISLYLGLFLDYGGERNLLIPIIIHALYDFLVFLVIMRSYKKSLNKISEKNQ